MWTNDTVQFARLLSELEAAGAFEGATLSLLTTSMDLQASEVIELKDRAVRLWDEVLQHANPAAWIEEAMGPEGLRPTSEDADNLVTPPTSVVPATDPAVVTAVRQVVAYNWHDEERDYHLPENETGRSAHVFRQLATLKEWLDRSEGEQSRFLPLTVEELECALRTLGELHSLGAIEENSQHLSSRQADIAARVSVFYD